MSKTFSEQLKDLEVEFLHGVPVKLPQSAIDAILTAYKASGKRVIGEVEAGMESKVTKIDDTKFIVDEWGDIASGFRNELKDEQSTRLAHEAGEK